MSRFRSPLLIVAMLAVCLVLAMVATQTSSQAADEVFVSARQTQNRVLAVPGALAASEDAALLHDYGSFGLYDVSDARLSSLRTAGFDMNVWAPDQLNVLEFEAYPFDTQTGRFRFPSPFSVDTPSAAALHMVQFNGPIKAEWLDAVAATGAEPIHYIATNGYLLWVDAGARSQLNAMVNTTDFVQFSAPYQTYFKLNEELLKRVTRIGAPDLANGSELVEVTIQMVRHPNQIATENAIAASAVSVTSAWTHILNYQNIRVVIPESDILTLAERPDVYWMGEFLPRQLDDEVQGQIMANNFDGAQTGPDSPGYLAFIDSYGFSTDPADYPVVDITDSGLGTGAVSTGDYSLHEFGDVSNPTRVTYVDNCTAGPDGGDTAGHGHINTSIVGGYDTQTADPYDDPDGYNRGLGISPYGRLASTRIFLGTSYDVSGCGGNDTGVIQSSWQSGALISTNSWGCSGCAGSYDDSSQAYDVGVRDADLSAGGNQELIIVFSAGNSGSAATIGTPGNGKNMITVGASENDRPTWTDGCGAGPSDADNAMDVAGFSSRGPAPGNRVKPELIAPGTHIQGTASTNSGYVGNGVCDQFQPPTQSIFASSSGTSHSTPGVAGAAQLYYYWLETMHGMSSPSPALMKAYLSAHTTYLTGVDANDDLPSNDQGYGMPNLEIGLDDVPRYMVDQTEIFDNSGETFTFQGSVADPTKPVFIVMAYTDAAGAIGTSPQVNDLNLSGTIGGMAYVGNNFSGRYSVTGGTPDSANNYEAIFLPSGTSGAIELTVTAFNIGGDGVPNSGDATDQDFALVCYNCAEQADFSLGATPTLQTICAPTDALFTVSVGSILGYNDMVTLSTSGEPAGSTTAFSVNPVTPAQPPVTSTLTIGNTGALAFGSYDIDVVGVATTSTHTTTVSVDVYTASPSMVTLQTPANGAINVPANTVFTWDAATQGSSYTIEIATDAGFVNIVESAMINATTYTASNLFTNVVYYWRVSSANICGAGVVSDVRSFTTEPAPGDCTIGTLPLVIMSDDFESGASGWTHDGGVGNTWALESSDAHSGAMSFHANDPAALSDQYLVSPQMSLPPAAFGPVTLQFWNRQSIEDNAGTGCYDGGIVEVSTDGGNTWTQIPNSAMLTDPYDGPVSTGFSNPIGGQDAWCGDPQDWLNSIVDLDAYAGETVQFRFRMTSDVTVGRDGWWVDDVRVQACTPSNSMYLPSAQHGP